MSFSNDVKKELTEIKENKMYSKIVKQGMRYLDKDSGSELNQSGDDKTIGCFLRGVFLLHGFITDPDKEYHLEIVPNDEEKCMNLYALINECGLGIKLSRRKGTAFLYIKESDIISDFLVYIGATNMAMELINIKIYKDVRNNVNRAVNCESGNIGKTARAAGKQILDIEYIYEKKGANFLPKELQEIAEIRLENIEMSLKEIGENCTPRISRSGVNHRFKKIEKIANELKKSNYE